MEILFVIGVIGLLAVWLVYLIDDGDIEWLTKNIISTIAFVIALAMWLSLTEVTYDRIDIIHLDEVSYYTDKGQVEFVPSNVLYIKKQNPRWGSIDNITYIYIYQE